MHIIQNTKCTFKCKKKKIQKKKSKNEDTHLHFDTLNKIHTDHLNAQNKTEDNHVHLETMNKTHPMHLNTQNK